MYCRKCGREIPGNALFCNYCGAVTGNSVNEPVVDSNVHQPETEYGYRRKEAKIRHFFFWLPAYIFTPVIIYYLIMAASGNLKNSSVPHDVSPSYEESSEQGTSSLILSNDSTEINLVKGSYLTQYSNTETIGAAFEKFFDQPKWEFVKDEGVNYVSFHGLATSTVNGKSVWISFLFLEKGGDFQIVSWHYGDVQQDMATLPTILNKIYEKGVE